MIHLSNNSTICLDLDTSDGESETDFLSNTSNKIEKSKKGEPTRNKDSSTDNETMFLMPDEDDDSELNQITPTSIHARKTDMPVSLTVLNDNSKSPALEFSTSKLSSVSEPVLATKQLTLSPAHGTNQNPSIISFPGLTSGQSPSLFIPFFLPSHATSSLINTSHVPAKDDLSVLNTSSPVSQKIVSTSSKTDLVQENCKSIIKLVDPKQSKQ